VLSVKLVAMAQEDWSGGGPAEEEGASTGERMQAVLEPIKKNLALIFIILVIAGGAFIYLFVLPKPGTIVLSVAELDAGKSFSDADVEIRDSSGNVIAALTLEEGSASAGGIPSGTDLTIALNTLKAGYASVTRHVTLESGQTKTVEITVPKSLQLQLGDIPEQTIGKGCSKTIAVSVTNNGDSDQTVELVADGDLKKAFGYEGPKTVPAMATESFSFTVNAPTGSDSLSGAIRAKYTAASAAFSATLMEPPDMRVDPSEIRSVCREGVCDAVQVSVSNYGKSDLTELTYEVSSDISGDLDVTGFEGKAVKPNKKTTFFVRGKTTGAGKVGKLKVISGCGEEEIPVSITSG